MSNPIRQKKIGRLIQKELGTIFQSIKWRSNKKELITVTDVCISSDIKIAKVYISIILSSDSSMTLHTVNKKKGEIKKELTKQIGKHMRFMPHLIFFLDETEKNASHIDLLIKKINIPPLESGAVSLE